MLLSDTPQKILEDTTTEELPKLDTETGEKEFKEIKKEIRNKQSKTISQRLKTLKDILNSYFS